MSKGLLYLAVGGNVLFVLWILANGIDEGFQARGPQIASYVGLVGLLLLNSFLLLRRRSEEG